MYVKKHIDNGRLILGACDESLIGKKIEDSTMVLDLSSSFYKGERLSESAFLDLVRKSYIVNAVGVDCIECLIKAEFIGKNEAKKLLNVPYIQLVFDAKID